MTACPLVDFSMAEEGRREKERRVEGGKGGGKEASASRGLGRRELMKERGLLLDVEKKGL